MKNPIDIKNLFFMGVLAKIGSNRCDWVTLLHIKLLKGSKNQKNMKHI